MIRPARFRYFIVLCALAALVVALASLLISYHLVDSVPWQRAFPENGWLIEFGRVLILILFNIYLLGDVFNREARILLSGRQAGSRSVAFTRRLALFLAVAESIALLLYSLFVGPRWLLEAQPLEGAGWRDTVLPYLAYLPYALVLYLVAFLPVLIVGLFGSLRDLATLHRKHRNLRRRLSWQLISVVNLHVDQPLTALSTDEEKDELLAHHDMINNEALYQFGAFCIDFLGIYGRYAAVILFWSISIVYEYQLGYQTTLERSRAIGLTGFLLALGVLIVISLGYLYYERAYARTSEVLIENARLHPRSEPLGLLEFEEKYSIFNLITKRFASRHLGVVVALIICLSLPPISRLLERIDHVWPG